MISQPDFYAPLLEHTTELMAGLQERADTAGIPFTTNHIGTMFGIFFTTANSVSNYQQVMACNTERFGQFFHGMLKEGVYLAPASYEAGFMSAAHTDIDIKYTLDAAARVFKKL